jgi:hypothetical protein
MSFGILGGGELSSFDFEHVPGIFGELFREFEHF